ncbi:MAG TPA: molybdopterin-dependent oxidoreductase [Nannocystis sp.]|jgi:DMSO/TMAO reductase YedYZ molybdopterin-dependent catalytic subunit
MRLTGLRPLALSLLLACACSDTGGGVGGVEVAVAGSARTWTHAELVAMPTASVAYHGKHYTGVPLPALVSALEASADRPLTAVASDGYTQTLAFEILAHTDALLAHTVDGAPLPASEGPLRLVVPGAEGLSVKQLVRLEQP